MSLRHLIIGGSGFIGRHVSRALIARGHSVSVADAVKLTTDEINSNFIKIDIATMQVQDIVDLIFKYQVIHHYAWSTIPSTANENPIADLLQNVGATLRLLEAAKLVGGRRIIFASSGGTVYGRLKSKSAQESDKLEPITAYGITKVACEHYLDLYRRQYDLDIRIARISNPFGAGQRANRGQGVISTFVYNAMFEGKVEIFGDGTVARDFIYIQDLANALCILSQMDIGSCDTPRIFNIGGGECRSVSSIVATIRDLLGADFVVNIGAERNFDVPINLLDISRARNYLGWSPQISVDQGIQLMIDDLRVDRYRLLSST